MSLALYLAAAYLLGAIPTAYLAGRALKGIDIRQHGSGNVGATNVFRVLGKGPGAFVLAFDMAKGTVSVTLLAGALGVEGPWVLVGGLAAVLGHNYTVFLGFKGGKGVASSAGVCLGLMPLSTLTVLGVFLVAFYASKMVSVGSLLGATVLPPLVWYYHEAGAAPPEPGQLFWLATALAAFVWVRHIPNLKRIMAGTENKFGSKP
jgi:glycerol-3-phosphate acyltransferase PlsY